MNDILFGNNNSKVITKLSKRYFKKNKVRNLAALLAIILTAFLFTSITSLAFNMASSIQLSLQMQKGSKADGTLGYMTEEQYEQLVNSDFVEQAGHRRIIGYASNTSSPVSYTHLDVYKRQANILKDLNIEEKIGAEIPIEFKNRQSGQMYHFDMIVSGIYDTPNEKSESVIAVSYTHLDVYKRQKKHRQSAFLQASGASLEENAYEYSRIYAGRTPSPADFENQYISQRQSRHQTL